MKGKILIAAAAALVLFSCTEKEMESPADTLEVTPATLDFGWKNNEPKTLTVKTNVEDWDFSADGWIEATVEGGNLVVNVTDNEEYEERTGKILVMAGNAKPVRVE
ncbi:MAG: BACON domain-containing protein, partial [Bacteroidetes bacterium]|nr:BACON domain-containing protein [Candidatus Cryptobacteroides faecigallinarum]